MNIVIKGANLPFFEMLASGRIMNRGTLTSPAGTGLWETYSFIYSNSQLKAELTVCRTFGPEPQPDAFFCIRQYAADAFCQPIIAEMYFFLYRICFLYDGNLKGICFRLHGDMCQKRHA